MAAPKSNLTRVTSPSVETGEVDFWLSDPEQMEDGDGTWGFAVFAAEDVWISTFTYHTREAATAARLAIIPVLKGCIYIGTGES